MGSDDFEKFFELYLQNQNRLEGNHLLYQLINNDSYYNEEEWWNKHAISTNVGLIVPEDMPLDSNLATVAISLLEADSIITWLNRIEGLGLQEDDDCKNVIEAIIEDWLPTPKTKFKNTIGSIPHVERLSSFCLMWTDYGRESTTDTDKLMGNSENFKTDTFETKLQWIRNNQPSFFRLDLRK